MDRKCLFKVTDVENFYHEEWVNIIKSEGEILMDFYQRQPKAETESKGASIKCYFKGFAFLYFIFFPLKQI